MVAEALGRVGGVPEVSLRNTKLRGTGTEGPWPISADVLGYFGWSYVLVMSPVLTNTCTIRLRQHENHNITTH